MRLADVSLYETILLDKAGHARDTPWARREIVKLDRLLSSVFSRIDRDRELVVVTSDHGNAEDLSTRSHTRARVPLLAFGVGAAAFVKGAVTLTDVAPRILAHWPAVAAVAATAAPLSSSSPG
jgi:2,3-bisphosphoglycerate-independent phosphoglycerate mutase